MDEITFEPFFFGKKVDYCNIFLSGVLIGLEKTCYPTNFLDLPLYTYIAKNAMTEKEAKAVSDKDVDLHVYDEHPDFVPYAYYPTFNSVENLVEYVKERK